MAEIVQLKDALAVAMAAEDAGNDQAFAAERMLRDAADLVKASNDRAAMWKTIAREILVKP
jgi:predicted HD phosphohydrolase